MYLINDLPVEVLVEILSLVDMDELLSIENGNSLKTVSFIQMTNDNKLFLGSN